MSVRTTGGIFDSEYQALAAAVNAVTPLTRGIGQRRETTPRFGSIPALGEGSISSEPTPVERPCCLLLNVRLPVSSTNLQAQPGRNGLSPHPPGADQDTGLRQEKPPLKSLFLLQASSLSLRTVTFSGWIRRATRNWNHRRCLRRNRR